MQLKHKLLTMIRQSFTWGDFIVPIILLMSINALWHPFGKPSFPIDAKRTSVIAKVDSLSVHLSNPSLQRTLLINVLQERMVIDGNGNSTTEDTKMQIRLFYAAILAGVISLLFRNSDPQKKGVGFVLLILIVLMYLLEVHRDDLYKRQVAIFSIKGIAVDSLVNLPPNDTTWFVLANEKVKAAYDTAEATRIPRKLLAACQPDPEQLLFYLIPLLGVYLFVIRRCLILKKK